MPVDYAALGIVVTIVIASVSSAVYIQQGFRGLEKAFYKALDLHKIEDGAKFETHSLQLQRLEITVFGKQTNDRV